MRTLMSTWKTVKTPFFLIFPIAGCLFAGFQSGSAAPAQGADSKAMTPAVSDDPAPVAEKKEGAGEAGPFSRPPSPEKGPAAVPSPEALAARLLETPAPPIVEMETLTSKDAGKHEISINLKSQRLVWKVDGKPALDTPVTTGRRSKPTPAGAFTVASKDEMGKDRGTYGDFVDRKGRILVPGVYPHLDPRPRHLLFQSRVRKYVLTLKPNGLTVHAGRVSGIPASDGNILVPDRIAQILYQHVRIGQVITILKE